MDLGFLKEKKLRQRIHTQNGTRYDVWVTEAERQHRGGIVVVYRAEKGW